MHERTRQLDQSLVEISIIAMPVQQPQILQHVVRLVEKLAVEAIKIAKVMRVQITSSERLNHRGDACAFVAHKLTMQ